MRALQRTLLILGLLALLPQTIRHVYVKWIEPRHSILASFDEPLDREIENADSLEELTRKYAAIHKEVQDRKIQGETQYNEAKFDQEPWKTERRLRSAISTWESQSKEIRELRFFWGCGMVALIIGVLAYRRRRAWLGVALMTVGFLEMIWWTSPSFRGSDAGVEFDRLLSNKLIFTIAALVLLLVVWLAAESRRFGHLPE